MSASPNPAATHSKADGIPPRARILAAAGELFYRHGIHAVGVETIAEAAGTNKMTLYRHFDSKDQLIAAVMRTLAAEFEAAGEKIAEAYAGDPKGRLLAWLRHMTDYKLTETNRGCALANAAI